MKAHLSSIIALAAVSTFAPSLWTVTPVYYEDFQDPFVSFHVGHDNGGENIRPIESLRLGYEVIPASSPLPAIGEGSFDLLHATGAQWKWRWVIGSTEITAMQLNSAGLARLWAPVDVNNHVRYAEIDPMGKITFSPQVANGLSVSLQFDGSNLLLGKTAGGTTTSSLILTQDTGDSRYLKINENKLQFGQGANAQSASSIALGPNSHANGVGALAIGSGFNEGSQVWELYANGKGATAIGYGSWARTDGAVAIGWNNDSMALGGVAMGNWNVVKETAPNGVSMGFNNVVFEDEGVAIGLLNWVAAPQGVALGANNDIRIGADRAFTAGYGNILEGPGSVGLGTNNETNGMASIALGSGNITDGDYAVALGGLTKAHATAALAAGWQSTADGAYATALGYLTKASGQAATAIGSGTQALSPNQLVVGSYNNPIVDPNGIPGNPNDAALIIGNGTSNLIRTNALVVRWNGNTETAGTITAKGEGTGKFNRFSAPILIPESGDISMGGFKAGGAP